jgi:hypothetical protein
MRTSIDRAEIPIVTRITGSDNHGPETVTCAVATVPLHGLHYARPQRQRGRIVG